MKKFLISAVFTLLLLFMLLFAATAQTCPTPGQLMSYTCGNVTHLWVEGTKTDCHYPYPDSVYLEWRIRCHQEANVTVLQTSVSDSISIFLGGAAVLKVKVVSYRGNEPSYMFIPTVCLQPTTDIQTWNCWSLSVPLPENTTFYFDGTIMEADTSYNIVRGKLYHIKKPFTVFLPK